ncbi:MAG TPA: sulfur carrier protein ThiS [Pyrinomonadaceae bacterium]|nr:sulfur carrier protein ThiS [Pyrinomonadaceae bacterium]
MQITLNGEKREFGEAQTIGELVQTLQLSDQRIAVELNKEIVRKKDWETTALNDADKIEIVHFVGGG